MELLVLLILFLINGFFSMSEMAVVASRKARLQQLTDEGRAGAGAALALANDPAIFLSTIQVGITVIGITSGAFGEARLSARVAEWLAQWPALAPRADAIAGTVVIVGITVGAVLLGELLPKRIALHHPESIASFVARPMRWISRLAYPLVRALSFMTDAILRLAGRRAAAGSPVTEEEIRVLMEQGKDAGIFEHHEHALVTRVFRMDDVRVTAVMTPRTDIVYLNLEEPLDVLLRFVAESPHSRFPITRGDLDHIEGIVEAKALLCDLVSKEPLDLERRHVKPLYIPETLTLTELLASFKKHRQRMAFIVNEYGELQGLVTISDVMQALVGDIAAVDSADDSDIVKRDENSWLIDGSIGVDRLKETLGIEDPLPDEGGGSYNTLGGFVMMKLGRIPRVGDRFDWANLRFEVVDMDRNRVDRLMVTRLAATSASLSGTNVA